MDTQATRKSLEASIAELPPLSRMLLKLTLFVGALALAWKMGFFTASGFATIAGIIAIFAMIFFAITSAEQGTRDTFYEYKEAIVDWFAKAMAEQVKEQKQTKEKVG